MKKIILSLFAFLIYSFPSFAALCNPADNIYDYLVPGCIRQDETYLATGTGSDVCLTSAKICAGTQIPNANLAALTSSSLVNGSALYSLSSTPSGAGALPIVNGGTGQTSRQASMDALFAASMSGTTGETLVSNGTDAVVGYPASLNIASMAQGDIPFVNSTPAIARLAAGTAGQVLVTGGASANPSWSTTLNVVSGNVGIGSATPGQKLDVQGTVRAVGFTMPTGASNGYVMTSNGSGSGSWASLPVYSVPHVLVGVFSDSTGTSSCNGCGVTPPHYYVIDSGTDWAGKTIHMQGEIELSSSASWTTGLQALVFTTSAPNYTYSANTYRYIVEDLVLATNSYTSLMTSSSSQTGIGIGTNASGNLCLVSIAQWTTGSSPIYSYAQFSGEITRSP